MHIFFKIILFFLPLYAQASIFDSIYSDDDSYIESTKSIAFNEIGTVEDISISMIEAIYFYDNNDFPNIQKLFADAMFSNNKEAVRAITALKLGNTELLKNYLKSKNLDVIKLEPQDIIWEIEGSTSTGKVILAKYQNYEISIETTKDGDYISTGTDNIIMQYNKSIFSYDEMQDSIDLSSASLYAALLNDRI